MTREILIRFEIPPAEASSIALGQSGKPVEHTGSTALEHSISSLISKSIFKNTPPRLSGFKYFHLPSFV